MTAEKFFNDKKYSHHESNIPDYLSNCISQKDAREYAIRFCIEQLEEVCDNDAASDPINKKIADLKSQLKP